MDSSLFTYHIDDDDCHYINLTAIVEEVEASACDTMARAQLRDGFVLYLEHYIIDDNPYTIDVNGDYWVMPDVALFVIDHVTSNFKIVAIKKRLMTGCRFMTPTVEGRLLCRYIVTGVGESGIDTKTKDSADIVTQIVTIFNNVMKLWL
jgi:hypothetical protein